MGNTTIEWATKVYNPVTGCTKISPGCDNCYAERMSKRFAEQWGLPADDPFKVTLHPDRLEEPLRWKKPARIFVCSMGDLFHDDVPFSFIHEVWGMMKACPQHTFLVLTKRSKRMKETIERIYRLERLGWAKGFWDHVWLGVTAENQEQADKRIPILLQIPAAVRFVSVEPMLSAVDLTNIHYDNITAIDALNGLHGFPIPHAKGPKLDWVICGGESGPGARPMHPDWVRSLRDQCHAAGVPFLFKQWGEWTDDHTGQHDHTNVITPYGKHLKGIPFGFNVKSSGSAYVYRAGKKKAGRLLDGQLWDEYPEVAP